MADNPLFEMGFPGPTVTAREIDTLPSRLAQAKGVQQAAVTKVNAAIDAQLEPSRQVADNAVGTLLEPVETALTEAGHVAAQAVQTGQLATVRALQQPLVQALKYGYINQGTPVISPTGKKSRSKKGGNGAVQAPVGTSPPPPSPTTQPQPILYGVLLDCARRQIAAVPGKPGAWTDPSFQVPPGWLVYEYVQMLPADVPQWMSSYGQQLLDAAVIGRKCLPSG